MARGQFIPLALRSRRLTLVLDLVLDDLWVELLLWVLVVCVAACVVVTYRTPLEGQYVFFFSHSSAV